MKTNPNCHKVTLGSKIVIGIMMLVMMAFFSVPVMAADVNFKGQTITFVVPVTPGGGFDTASRMLVPYLEKHLPGHPNVIVKNVPGGEWNIGINKMTKS